MSQELQAAHETQLRQMPPFVSMTDDRLGTVLEDGQFLHISEGHLLFKRSTDNTKSHFLLSGQLNLVNDAFENTPFTPETGMKRGMVDESETHSVSAVAACECIIFEIDRAKLEPPKPTGQGSWMENLLSTPLFEFVPPNNIQSLFKRFEPIAIGANQTIITQGDAGDYFYVIKTGRVAIDQTTAGETKRVAEMSAGSSFGQDALISDAPRNATVTTLESCELMRLSESDFSELLMSPVIEYVTLQEVDAVKSMHTKPPIFIDVRSNLEVQPLEISDPVKRIPLPLLRDEMRGFDVDPIYLVIGPQRPKIAEVAAYLLNEAGFSAYVVSLPES